MRFGSVAERQHVADRDAQRSGRHHAEQRVDRNALVFGRVGQIPSNPAG